MKRFDPWLIVCVLVLAATVLSTYAAAPLSKPAAVEASGAGTSLEGLALPKEARVMPSNLLVAPQAAKVFYCTEKERKNAETEYTSFVAGAGMEAPLDLKKLFPDLPAESHVWPRSISPDGKMALLEVTGKPFEGQSAYLLNLDKLTIAKVADDCGEGQWLGNQVVFNQSGRDRKTRITKLYDPVSKRAETIPSANIILQADPNGQFLVAFEGGNTVVLDQRGTKLRELLAGSVGGCSMMPVLSAHGRYMAVPIVPPGGTKYEIHVLSIDGKEKWTLKKEASLLGVTDNGDVLTLEPFEAECDESKTLALWNAKGVRKKLDTARAAALVGGRVFYISQGKKPVIKVIDLPNRRKARIPLAKVEAAQAVTQPAGTLGAD